MDKELIKNLAVNYANTIIGDKNNPIWQTIYLAFKNGFELSCALCDGKETTDELSNCIKPAVSGLLPVKYCPQCGEPLARKKHKFWCEHSGNNR